MHIDTYVVLYNEWAFMYNMFHQTISLLLFYFAFYYVVVWQHEFQVQIVFYKHVVKRGLEFEVKTSRHRL